MIRADCHQQKQPFAGFVKRRLQHRCFPAHFTKSSWTPLLQNTSGQLLLHQKIHSTFAKADVAGCIYVSSNSSNYVNDTVQKYFLSTNMTYNRLKMKIIIIIIIIVIINTSQVHFFISNSGQAARNPQSWLYFQDFQGSVLLNGCLVVWT